jgi:hypothetical protein
VDRVRYERPAVIEQPGMGPRDAVDTIAAAEIEEFAALMGANRLSLFASRSGPAEDLADFIMPKLGRPAVLQSGRALEILEELVGAILPTFNDSQEFQSVATAVVRSEIARRRDLQDRLHQGISA